MSDKMSDKKLIKFECKVAKLFKEKKIHYPVHLSGGNEKQLIDIFKGINKEDYIFSTHRNHYHALLKGIPEKQLLHNMLTDNEIGSMHTISVKHRFYSSATVAGCVAIACGVALAIKMTRGRGKVWAFCGDGCLDEGWFTEAVRYANCNSLPITYVIEDNDRSVCTSVANRWGRNYELVDTDNILYYRYTPTWPHCGIGEYVSF